MPKERNDLRKERYAKLRELGFSSKEALRLRDLSAINIQKVIVQRESNLKKVEKPTEKQRIQRERLDEERPRLRTSITGTRNQRLTNFKRWSKAKRFPKEINDFITGQNVEAGKDILNSYGYRIFYHMYVNKLPEAEAIRRLEQNDT